jgi:hypothetical protein
VASGAHAVRLGKEVREAGETRPLERALVARGLALGEDHVRREEDARARRVLAERERGGDVRVGPRLRGPERAGADDEAAAVGRAQARRARGGEARSQRSLELGDVREQRARERAARRGHVGAGEDALGAERAVDPAARAGDRVGARAQGRVRRPHVEHVALGRERAQPGREAREQVRLRGRVDRERGVEQRRDHDARD